MEGRLDNRDVILTSRLDISYISLPDILRRDAYKVQTEIDYWLYVSGLASRSKPANAVRPSVVVQDPIVEVVLARRQRD